MANLEIGKVVSFSTLAAAHLGAIVKNAKLLSIMDYDTAMLYEAVNVKHRAILPVLPTGTPSDPAAAIYYRFLSESGAKIVLSQYWINMATIELVNAISFRATVNNASFQDIGRVRDALAALGYANFLIEQI